jgi:uncharacterized membrane protein
MNIKHKNILQALACAVVAVWFGLSIIAVAQLSPPDDPWASWLALLYLIAGLLFLGLSLWRFILSFRE